MKSKHWLFSNNDFFYHYENNICKEICNDHITNSLYFSTDCSVEIGRNVCTIIYSNIII